MTLTRRFSDEELAEMVKAMAAKLQKPTDQISLVQHDNGLLTVTVSGASFTGTVDEIWKWLDSFTHGYEPDFGP